MAQHNNEHLTNAQLSAYLDKELTPGELALCAAHVQTCQTCQEELTDLRLTSSLLRGMPQVEVPRSFALPLNLTVLPSTPASAEQHMRQPSRGRYILKRSLRALSTIAAVLGLMFILAGLITALPQHGAMMTTSNSASGLSQPAVRTAPTKPQITGSAATPATQNTKPTPVASIPNTATHSAIQQGGPPPEQQSGLPTALDLSQPAGRLGIGSVLFLLGILGVVLTRRFRRAPAY